MDREQFFTTKNSVYTWYLHSLQLCMENIDILSVYSPQLLPQDHSPMSRSFARLNHNAKILWPLQTTDY